MTSFFAPLAASLGEVGQKFMQELNRQRTFQKSMSAASGLTVLSGLIMYFVSFKGLAPLDNMRGMGLTVGSLAGVLAFIVASTLQRRSFNRMRAIGAEIAAAGGPPSAEQGAEMQALQETVAKGGAWTAILIVISLVGMSIS